MSGSGFATAAADMGALHERISAASATLSNFEFPGEGKVERAFAAVQASLAADAESAGQYANDAAKVCGEQDFIDHGLELAPTRDDLNALLRSGDHAALDAAVEDHQQAIIAHENSTLGNAFPTAPVGTCGVPTDDSFAGEGESGSGEDDGDLSGLDGEGNEDEDKPVTMSEPGDSKPVTMSEPSDSPRVQMSDGLPRPTPLSDNAVSTETSADNMPPTTGAGTGTLSQPTQPTPGGTPIQGAHGAPNPTFGATGGRSPQLGSSTGSRGTAPKTAQRKDDDTTSASTAAPIVPVAGVTSTPATTSPASTPPGTGTPPPTTAPTAPGQGGTGQGGVGGGGLAGAGARPPQQPMGSGETVTGQTNKPILRYEEPIEPQPGDDNYDWFTHGETDDPLLSDDDKKGAA